MFFSYKRQLYSFKPDDVDIDDAIRKTILLEQCIYRLLILDSFSGYYNLEIYKYCLQFDIIIVFLPLHSSYKI